MKRSQRTVKPATTLLLAAFAVGACRERPRTPRGEIPRLHVEKIPVITPNGVGPVALGKPLHTDATKELAIRDTTIALEGEVQPAALVALGIDTVVAEIVDGRVWRIQVRSGGLGTADDIRVGSPVSRLLTKGVHGAAGEDRIYVLDPAHCGLSFGLDPRRVPVNGDLDSAALARLGPAGVVDEILVVGCDEPGA